MKQKKTHKVILYWSFNTCILTSLLKDGFKSKYVVVLNYMYFLFKTARGGGVLVFHFKSFNDLVINIIKSGSNVKNSLNWYMFNINLSQRM